MSLLNMLKDLRSASPLGSMLTLGIKQVATKDHADKVYRSLVSLLHEQIKLGKMINDPIIKNAQDVLENLPPFGARRRNFKMWYIGSTAKLLKLPHDPDELSFGCWW